MKSASNFLSKISHKKGFQNRPVL